MRVGFYDDRRWCSHCHAYVYYLEGLHGAYCAECGGAVRLFRRRDWRRLMRGQAADGPPLHDDPGHRPDHRHAG